MHRHPVLACAGVLAAAFLLTGCSSPARGPAAEAAARATPRVAWTGDPRGLPAVDGTDGTPLTWTDVLARLAEAEAIVVGEQHDDAAGHAVQAALVADVLEARRGGAVALEMLERHEQVLVDDWMDGFITAEALAEQTRSENWAGLGAWAAWYQPILDAARDAGGTVIAANAPRQYVRAMRTDGPARVDALPPPRRGFVELPRELDDAAYRERFRSVMDGAPYDPSDAEAVPPRWLATFRAQRTWDATMGDSVARGLNRGLPVVLLMIGQFHSDFEGATVLELRARRPGARVVTISLQPTGGPGLRSEDAGRADIVIYTGPKRLGGATG